MPTCRTMQVIFLKILSSSAAIVATFMTLSTLLMMNLLNSSPHHDDYDVVNRARNSHYTSGASRQIMTVPHLEEHTLSDFESLTATVWNPLDYQVVLTPSPACKANLPVLILVTSAPEHYERRKAIRETWSRDWANPNSTEWKTIFMLGQSANPSLDAMLKKESAQHGDILMGNYLDSYRNLTLKVQHGMAWALENCQPQYLLKTDDDCFVNSKILTNFLQNSNKQRTKLYAGFPIKSLEVVRDEKSRWYISRESYRPAKFPRYASGTGYIISLDVLRDVVSTAPYVTPFAAEDAYIGLLAKYIKVPLLDSARFALNNVNWRLCNYLFLLVVHGVTPEQQVLGLRNSIESKLKCNNQPESDDWN